MSNLVPILAVSSLLSMEELGEQVSSHSISTRRPVSHFAKLVEANAFSLTSIVTFLKLADVVKLLAVLMRKELQGGELVQVHQAVMVDVGFINEVIAAAWAQRAGHRWSGRVHPSTFLCTGYGDAERRVAAHWLYMVCRWPRFCALRPLISLPAHDTHLPLPHNHRSSKVFCMVKVLPECFELEESTEPTAPTSKYNTRISTWGSFGSSRTANAVEPTPLYAVTNSSTSAGTTLFAASWDIVTSSGLLPFAFCLQVPSAKCTFTGLLPYRGLCASTSLLCCFNCNELMQACNSCADSCSCPNPNCDLVGPLCPACRITDDATGDIVGCIMCTFFCKGCKAEVGAQLMACCAGELCELHELGADVCLECFAGLTAERADLTGVTFSSCNYSDSGVRCGKIMCSRCTATCEGVPNCEGLQPHCRNKPFCQEHFDNGEQGGTCVQCHRSTCRSGCSLPGTRDSFCNVQWCSVCEQFKCGQLNGEKGFADSCTTFELCDTCEMWQVCLDCKMTSAAPHSPFMCPCCTRRSKQRQSKK